MRPGEIFLGAVDSRTWSAVASKLKDLLGL